MICKQPSPAATGIANLNVTCKERNVSKIADNRKRIQHQPITGNIIKQEKMLIRKIELSHVLISLIATCGILISCKDEIVVEPLNGGISGVINISDMGLPLESLVDQFDRTGEAFLILDGDTISHQLIESSEFFEGGEFVFNNLDKGKYELILRKEGFIDRHFKNISIDQENKYAREFITLYEIPQMEIENIEARIQNSVEDGAYEINLSGRFSNLSEGVNNFVIQFSSTNEIDPSKVDFNKYLLTYEEEIQDTIPMFKLLFEEYGYNSGDLVYMNFIPQSRSWQDESISFGSDAEEVGIPYLNLKNVVTVSNLMPH